MRGARRPSLYQRCSASVAPWRWPDWRRYVPQRACELGSEDPTNWHLIGMWEFTVADISWVMRKLATVVYGEPPKATFEEALEHFAKAEALAEGFSQQSAGQGLEWPIRR